MLPFEELYTAKLAITPDNLYNGHAKIICESLLALSNQTLYSKQDLLKEECHTTFN